MCQEWFTFLNMLRELGCLDLAGALVPGKDCLTFNEDEGSVCVYVCVCGCVYVTRAHGHLLSAAW